MDIVPQKRCTMCGQKFPATPEYFYKLAKGKYGIASQCIKCSLASGRERTRICALARPARVGIVDNKQQCTICGEWKSATNEFFEVEPRNTDGLRKQCKLCRLSQSRKRIESTPEFQKKLELRAAKPSHDSPEYRTILKQRDREKYLRYREKPFYLERQYAQRRAKYSNPIEREKKNAIERERYANNPSCKEQAKARRIKREKTPEGKLVRIALKHRYQAREKELPATLTAKEWKYALEYFHNCCAVCGRQLKDLFGTHTASCDHWIALNDPNCPGTIAKNCVPLCNGVGGCNQSKQDKNPFNWLAQKYGKRKAREKLKEIQLYFDSLE